MNSSPHPELGAKQPERKKNRDKWKSLIELPFQVWIYPADLRTHAGTRLRTRMHTHTCTHTHTRTHTLLRYRRGQQYQDRKSKKYIFQSTASLSTPCLLPRLNYRVPQSEPAVQSRSIPGNPWPGPQRATPLNPNCAPLCPSPFSVILSLES